ncbi:aldehyde dehydrogenase family protein [Polaromonas sp. C04]|uniref:aldehyde dehydrogenase family protein n=1 Tax=Polaromonas sp. C04 TaxID=1945857 RepID=UPI0009D0FD2D|nr:aldehyde dehydrogenase family protein [Polaromonas sp. C04]OOG53097.1 hypothetical protein B0E49_11470 [Polaromonas sp. C04]
MNSHSTNLHKEATHDCSQNIEPAHGGYADSLDELAARANDTDFGLSAGIWTRDIGRAHKLARRIRSGNVRVNAAVAPDFAMPFGGYKQSGWGRENVREGVEAYTELKSIAIDLG